MSKLYNENKEVRDQIDANLKRMAHLNANIGLDTPKEEKESVKSQILECQENIKKLDEEFYLEICPSKDEEI